MSIAVLLVLLVVLAAGGFAFALARSGQREYAAQGEVIPGLASEAPASWAGAHTPEARMHRRLGQAIKGLRAVAGQPGESVRLLELRVELEQHALEVDRRLIATANMPEAARQQALPRAEQAVAAVEQAAGQLALEISGADADGFGERGLADLAERIAMLVEARRDLDALDATAPPSAQDEHEQGEDGQGGQPQPGTA